MGASSGTLWDTTQDVFCALSWASVTCNQERPDEVV